MTHADGFSAFIRDLAESQARDLSGIPTARYPEQSAYPDHAAPDMLYAIDRDGTKACRLCGKSFAQRSQGYHAHGSMHVREGHAEVVATLRYLRWYQLTDAGRIIYATRGDT